jgi:hypothetical protein
MIKVLLRSKRHVPLACYLTQIPRASIISNSTNLPIYQFTSLSTCQLTKQQQVCPRFEIHPGSRDVAARAVSGQPVL